MFCEIDGIKVTDLNLKKLEKEFPQYKHLFGKPLRFVLHPSLFKKDPDNENKFMVRRRHGLKTKFSYNDENSVTHTFQYFVNKQPHKTNPQLSVFLPKFIHLEYGEMVVDLRPGSGRVNIALAYFMLMHPEFQNEYLLEDTRADANKKLIKDEQTFKALSMFFDKSNPRYVSDGDLENVAKAMGMAGMSGKDPSIIRNALVAKAQEDPMKFESFEGTKQSKITALVTECEEYKILHYLVNKKTWRWTEMLEVPAPQMVRTIGGNIISCQNATVAKEELVKYLTEVDPENFVSKLETLLEGEKMRVGAIATEFKVDVDDLLSSILIQNKVTSPIE